MIQFTLGMQLRRARRDAGLSLRQLASLVHVSHVHLGRVEKDRTKPTSQTLGMLALALHQSSDHLHLLAGIIPHDLVPLIVKHIAPVRALLGANR